MPNRKMVAKPAIVQVKGSETIKTPILGDPDMKQSCTFHIERQNGTLRQWCKRLARLTYPFSKKWGNLRSALALHFAFFKFCRVHGKLRVTPAMEAGVSDHIVVNRGIRLRRDHAKTPLPEFARELESGRD